MRQGVNRGRLMIAAALMAAVVPFAQAGAQCCVGYYDYTNANNNKTAIVNRINTEETDIITALKNLSGQQTLNSNAQTTAQSNMQDVVDARTTQRAVQQQTVSSILNATSAPSSCNIITGNLGAQSADAVRTSIVAGITSAQRDWDTGGMVNGQATPATKGRQDVAKAQLSIHCGNNYGLQADVDSGACPSKGSQPGRDLDIGTILGQGTMTAMDTQKAAQFFVANTVTRVPLGGLPAGYGKTPKGIADVASRNVDVSRASIAAYILSQLLANHSDVSGQATGTSGQVVGSNGGSVSLSGWAESTAKETLGYNPSGNNFPNGVSNFDFMKLSSKRWYFNPNWISNLDPNTAQKETAQILAWIAYQNQEAYALQEQEASALATIVAILEDEHRVRAGMAP